jgi:hypothetical protein
MKHKLKQIRQLALECLESDADNPEWDTELLSCIARIECNAARAVELAAFEHTDPFFLTRETIKSFKAVK